MNVKYNSENKVFEVKDGLRTTYVVLMALCLINILNGVIYFIGNPVPAFEFLHYMWILIALTSLVLLWFFIFRKSTLSKVPYNQIQSVVEKKSSERRNCNCNSKTAKPGTCLR